MKSPCQDRSDTRLEPAVLCFSTTIEGPSRERRGSSFASTARWEVPSTCLRTYRKSRPSKISRMCTILFLTPPAELRITGPESCPSPWSTSCGAPLTAGPSLRTRTAVCRKRCGCVWMPFSTSSISSTSWFNCERAS